MSINDKIKSLITLLLRLLVTAGALVWVFRLVDLTSLKQAVTQVKWHLLAVVWVFNATLFWIRSYRFQLILKKLECYATVSTLFGSSGVMALYGMIMPGMLSLAAKWYVIKRATGKGGHVISAMVYNQVSIIVVMAAFGLLALVMTNPLKQLSLTESQAHWLSIGGVLLFMGISLIYICVLNQQAGRYLDRFMDRLISSMPQFIRLKADVILTQIRVFRTLGFTFHFIIALLAFITGPLGCGVLYLLAAHATNITTVPFIVIVWVQAIIFILGRIPISIANCGVREFVLIGLLGIYGIDQSLALLMSAIVFSAHIFMAFIGALYQILWSLSKKRAL